MQRREYSPVVTSGSLLGDTTNGKTLQVTALYEGHFDEITKLAIVGPNIISASLDGTIRTWDTRLPPPKLETPKQPEPMKDINALTEEEERELAELMSSDDE